MDLKETELTLGLPGKSIDHETEARRSMKRNSKTRSRKSEEEEQGGEAAAASASRYSTDATPSSSEGHQLVGWPPVKASRAGKMNKNSSGGCKYVKVAVDGAPYLRKVDLERYDGYAQLLQALQDLFPPFTVRNYYFSEGYTLMDGLVPTFEDKDGDWMMVGDFPWKMFKESCKRIRLMKNSEAIGSD